MRGAALLFFFLLASQALADPRPYRPDITGDWPPAFPIYCGEHPQDCAPLGPSESSAPVDFLKWQSRIEDVNTEVNLSIKFRAEEGDHWDAGVAYGDCDDYALTKRNKLLAMGLSRGVVRTAHVLPFGDHQMHIVLVVLTNEGFKVLDNRAANVYDLDQMMADRVSVQSARNPKNWELQN